MITIQRYRLVLCAMGAGVFMALSGAPGRAATATDASSSADTALGEIIVTANKLTAQSVLDAPVSIQAISGDATLFIRRDEVETAWQIVDSVRNSWADKPLTNREFYAAGTWGPIAADDLLAQSGHQWHEPQVIK